ncbi:MAG: LuxR C-terminal-related transcriptional regulator [Agriterribacter sp.]
MKDVFEKQYKKLKLLKLIQADNTISNKQIAVTLHLSEETVKSYNKDMLQKLKSILGYQFVSLREAVISLTSKGYL